MASWLEDLLANLQGTGNPPMFQSSNPIFPPTPAQLEAAQAGEAQAARDAAGERMVRANQRRALPFGVPDMNSAGIQLAMDQAPAGTGVAGPLGNAPHIPDGSPFGMVPPSLTMAKAMTAPPEADGLSLPPSMGPPPTPAVEGLSLPPAMGGPGMPPAMAAAPPAEAPMPERVPLPRPRPDMPPATDLSSRNRPAPVAAEPPAVIPAAPAPEMPAAPPERSFGDRVKGWAPGLLAAGAAFQGDNTVAAAMLKRQEEQALLQENQNVTARALLARGAAPEDIRAAVRNPDLMKALVTKYFETKPAVNVGGRLVRERPDGKVDVIYDNVDEKAPPQRELKLPGGGVQQQEWVDGKWKNVADIVPGEQKMPGQREVKLADGGVQQQEWNARAGRWEDVGGPVALDQKAPTQREIKLPDGSVQQQEWDRRTGKWLDVGKPAPGERDRRLSVSDITKLSEEGQKMDQVRGFTSSFKPEFAGYKVNAVGNAVNKAGRNLPESVVGKDIAAGASWWQEYDRYKNVVRHGLYGASLTKNEQEAFLAADITPGMDPAQIQRNLATQQRLVENSIRRKGKALIGSTYDREAIAKAYGVSPDFFDQPDTPAPQRGGTIDVGGQKIKWSVN